jgi:2-dehydropantoate 2-reductase
MMREAQAVAHKLGISFRVPLEKRIAGAEKVGSTRRRCCRTSRPADAPRSTRSWARCVELARADRTRRRRASRHRHALVKLLAQTNRRRRMRARPVLRLGMRERARATRRPERGARSGAGR